MDNNNTMEYRIGLEKQNKRNDQVTELILDNCRATQISGLTDEFINLETLSLINVGLVTLKGFPKLPKLKKLELSDNRLTGGLNLLHGSPKLQHLNISGNRIKDLEALEPLKEFHDLVNLDLYNCEVTKSDDYRQKVFGLLPNLNSLDGYDRNEREVADSDESDEEGSDVENRITREDNESEEEEDDVENESSEYAGSDINGVESFAGSEEDDDDEEEGEDDDDDDADADDDDDDDEDDEEAEDEADEVVANATNQDESLNAENGDEDGDDDEEDEEGLKQLQKDIGEDEDSDDDDFEPTEEPEARDYEIDPEDDGDDDYLSTSNLNASAASSDPKSRGQKRKHEDEAGDEVDDE